MNNYKVFGYTIVFYRNEEDDTHEHRIFNCDTSAEIGRILETEFWSYWDGFRVIAEAMNLDTGELEDILLP